MAFEAARMFHMIFLKTVIESKMVFLLPKKKLAE